MQDLQEAYEDFNSLFMLQFGSQISGAKPTCCCCYCLPGCADESEAALASILATRGLSAFAGALHCALRNPQAGLAIRLGSVLTGIGPPSPQGPHPGEGGWGVVWGRAAVGRQVRWKGAQGLSSRQAVTGERCLSCLP
jgi:hypothetical protein